MRDAGTAASAVEELSASIGNISGQASSASTVVAEAKRCAEIAVTNAGGLSDTVVQIERVTALVDQHMPNSEWRHRLARLVERLLDESRDALAAWGPAMLGARPYTALIERHVELYARVQLLRYMIDDPEDAELDELQESAARARRLSASRRAVPKVPTKALLAWDWICTPPTSGS